MVLIVDSQPARLQLRSWLKLPRGEVAVARSLARAIDVAAARNPAGIVVAARTAGPGLPELLRTLHAAVPRASVMVVHEDRGSLRDAVRCFRAGAAAYFDHRDRDRLRLLLNLAIVSHRALAAGPSPSSRRAPRRRWGKRPAVRKIAPSHRIA
jgi:DNA-binding NtrC family response regulator